jgi:hypothetical protein
MTKTTVFYSTLKSLIKFDYDFENIFSYTNPDDYQVIGTDEEFRAFIEDKYDTTPFYQYHGSKIYSDSLAEHFQEIEFFEDDFINEFYTQKHFQAFQMFKNRAEILS